MQYVSSTDARNNFSEMIARARREPIVVRKKGRDAVVMISPEDYQKIRHQNVQDFHRLCEEISHSAAKAGLTPNALDAILNDDA